MEALRVSPIHSLRNIPTKLAKTQSDRLIFFLNSKSIPTSPFSLSHQQKVSKSKLFTAMPSSVPTEPADPPQAELETETQNEKFDWYSQWYPIMPLCDLDKRKPHGKKVMGIDLVVWWDRNENAWKVFDDTCPHRLAPLSEGRIDQWGRLQCVYHGWCFNGAGDCKFIPQAPPDGPPVINSLEKLHVAYFYSFFPV